MLSRPVLGLALCALGATSAGCALNTSQYSFDGPGGAPGAAGAQGGAGAGGVGGDGQAGASAGGPSGGSGKGGAGGGAGPGGSSGAGGLSGASGTGGVSGSGGAGGLSGASGTGGVSGSGGAGGLSGASGTGGVSGSGGAGGLSGAGGAAGLSGAGGAGAGGSSGAGGGMPTCTPNKVQCSGQLLLTCNSDGSGYINPVPCMAGTFCDAAANNGQGACDLCMPGVYSCDMAQLLQCDVSGQKLNPVAACGSAALCVPGPPGTGMCSVASCSAGQMQCQGAQPQICKDDRTGFQDKGAVCGAAGCNPATGTCYSCMPNQVQCAGDTLEICAADGMSQQTTPCPAGTCSAQMKQCTACTGSGYSCSGQTLLQCSNGTPKIASVCGSGEICDAALGHCDTCAPGSFSCMGQTLFQCDPSGLAVAKQKDCTSGPCDAKLGQCDLCTPGSYSCSGATLQLCNPDGNTFTNQSCVSSGLCNAKAHQCDTPACTPGEQQCSGKKLSTCSADQTGFVPSAVCGSSQICDAAEGCASVDYVFAGGGHACAVLGKRLSLYCWGDNSDGQLGNGMSGASVASPQRVLLDPASNPATPYLEGIVSVALGELHTCALDYNGVVYCWGSNANGALGVGLASGALSGAVYPMKLAPLDGIGPYSLAAAGGTTCSAGRPKYGSSFEIAAPVHCWGRGADGVLGNGQTADALAPVAVSNLGSALIVAVAPEHACAVVPSGSQPGSSKEIFCWGRNGKGQLGVGPTQLADTTAPTTPVQDQNGPVSSSEALQVVSGGGGSSLAGPVGHSCARVGPDGSVLCWGANDQGQLGQPAMLMFSPLAMPIKNGFPRMSYLTAGASHNCALQANMAGQPTPIFCWGNNTSDQAGQSGVASVNPPAVINGTQTKLFRGLVAGDAFSCALDATVMPNQILCLGANDRGQLGTGVAGAPVATPAAVVFP